MRLCYFLNGRHTSIYFSPSITLNGDKIVEFVEEHEANFVRDDEVHNLFIDFEAEHVPVHNKHELEMVCRLLAAYHNNCIRLGLQVRHIHVR